MKTTLNRIREQDPCASGWTQLLRNLGKTTADDEPLAIATILESNGVDDALWCLRAVEGYQSEIRLFAVDCARSVQHLMTDPRSIAVIDVAEKYAYGGATDAELAAAWNAAREAAREAAWATRGAADVAWNATRDAAWDAAWATANAARGVAWDAAWAARDVAWATAWKAADAAWNAARDTQANLLCLMCIEIEMREQI